MHGCWTWYFPVFPPWLCQGLQLLDSFWSGYVRRLWPPKSLQVAPTRNFASRLSQTNGCQSSLTIKNSNPHVSVLELTTHFLLTFVYVTILVGYNAVCSGLFHLIQNVAGLPTRLDQPPTEDVANMKGFVLLVPGAYPKTSQCFMVVVPSYESVSAN